MPDPKGQRFAVLKGTARECGRVALARWFGHDPYGMLLRDRPWREIVRRTYAAHLDAERGRFR